MLLQRACSLRVFKLCARYEIVLQPFNLLKSKFAGLWQNMSATASPNFVKKFCFFAKLQEKFYWYVFFKHSVIQHRLHKFENYREYAESRTIRPNSDNKFEEAGWYILINIIINLKVNNRKFKCNSVTTTHSGDRVNLGRALISVRT